MNPAEVQLKMTSDCIFVLSVTITGQSTRA